MFHLLEDLDLEVGYLLADEVLEDDPNLWLLGLWYLEDDGLRAVEPLEVLLALGYLPAVNEAEREGAADLNDEGEELEPEAEPPPSVQLEEAALYPAHAQQQLIELQLQLQLASYSRPRFKSEMAPWWE